MSDHVDDEANVEPEEREADECASGGDGEARAHQLVSRLKLLHRVHLHTPASQHTDLQPPT